MERASCSINGDRVMDSTFFGSFPGHVRSRTQLMDDASILVDDQTITSHIKRIRRKFKVIDKSFAKLATVYGAGYRWNNAGE